MEGQIEQTKLKHILVVSLFVIAAVIIFGLLWFFVISPSSPTGFGWFLFSFAAGLTMIVLPCTLPLAFVIVPLSMGKGIAKGLGIAIAFGLGIAITLSFYGVLAAIVGKVAIGSLGAPLEVVKNWVYFIAGIFALLFALGEIGLVKFRMPSYTGAAPAFIQRRKDLAKAFFLGLFLGNIGVGCPHPATPLILIEIASSGNVAYGWLLFFVHAVGRVLPLLFLAFLGILGVNGLKWLVARKDKVEKATGWAMVFVAGFILTLGLFSHKWWVNSGIHTQLEKITQEERILGVVRDNLNSTVSHTHGIETGTGLFGLPLWLGNWFLVLLWIIPIWIWWYRKKRSIAAIPETNTVGEKIAEVKTLNAKKYMFLSVTALVALVFIYILPHNFMKHASSAHDHAPGIQEDHPHDMQSDLHEHSLATPEDHPHNSLESAHDHAPATPEVHEHMDCAAHHDHASGTPDDHPHGSSCPVQTTNEHAGHGAMVHEEGDVKEGIVVNFNPEEKITAGESAPLEFFVNDLPQKTPITNLDLSHEKYIHVIGVKSDLSNFFHIHPNPSGAGLWSVEHIFKEAGEYKLWSDVTYQGATHSFGHERFEVLPDTSSEAQDASVKYVEFFKNVVVDNYQVAIDYPEPIVAGRETPVDFILKDWSGNGIEVEDYLGAQMHLAVLKDDLSVYVHTHPLDHEHREIEGPADDGHDHSHSLLKKVFVEEALAHGTAATSGAIEPSHISFNVNFPSAGVYKMFAQFRPKGINLPVDQSLVAEFYVKVAETGPEYPQAAEALPKIPSKGVLVAISLALIVVLGFFVNKFTNLKS